jgi:hypothetical protein
VRSVPLTVLQGGIQRLRVKGGASGASLYDLVNGYITQAGSIAQREGTTRFAALDATTVGLCAIDGVFNVFSTALETVPAGFQANLLIHPTDSTQTLKKIWFAQPFMGFPYVVAEFANGNIFHYWLQSGGSWAADTVYQDGAIVTPTVLNGLAYQALRDLQTYPAWSPQTAVKASATLLDPNATIVEPSTPTGYVYQAVSVAGTSPHTGDTEPTWPSTEGAQIQEFGDFSTSSGGTSSASSSTTPLSSALTDRYGDSIEIAGQTGTASSSSSSSVTASTTISQWSAGETVIPGTVVQPSTNQGAFVNAIPNGDFESGNDGNWVLGTGWSIVNDGSAYQGSWSAAFGHTGSGFFDTTMAAGQSVTPGQSVTATAYARGDSDGQICLFLSWYDASNVLISTVKGAFGNGGGGSYNPPNYGPISVTGSAPANAATVKAGFEFGTGSSSARSGRVDLVSWNLEKPAAVSQFLYEAVQADAASTGSTEPAWPTVAGNTVVDGGVTWKAIGTSIITWQAIPIMKSGAAQPAWPTAVGQSVSDGNMSWLCINRQVTDSKCPQTNAVALGASHVFAVDKDIVPYSAAVNPTDWTTANNAGYLPTGLNNYGANPAAALGLYRSNLVVFNAGGYQMWQVDPDPQNMALLDAQPVGSTWPRAIQSVADDLVFLTAVGVRNLAAAGPAASMQSGNTGQAIDPIVQARLQAGTYDPLSLYYPGRGQYWLIFGPEALVLTVHGGGGFGSGYAGYGLSPGQKSWSRYVFPDTITDWTLNGGALYLRTAGNLVWKVDPTALLDDAGGANTNFLGTIQWPYLDCGPLGTNKMLVGLDLVGAGDVKIQVGFNQNDPTSFSDNAGFATSGSVTAAYEISAADTVPGQPIPLPLTGPSFSLVLTFSANQVWNLQAANLYLADSRGAGAVS